MCKWMFAAFKAPPDHRFEDSCTDFWLLAFAGRAKPRLAPVSTHLMSRNPGEKTDRTESLNILCLEAVSGSFVNETFDCPKSMAHESSVPELARRPA